MSVLDEVLKNKNSKDDIFCSCHNGQRLNFGVKNNQKVSSALRKSEVCNEWGQSSLAAVRYPKGSNKKRKIIQSS